MIIKSYDAWRCGFAGSSIKQTNRWENMKTGIVLFSWLTAVAAWAQTYPQGMVTLDSTAGDVPIYYWPTGTRAPGEVFVEIMASAPGEYDFRSIDVMSETGNTVRYLDLGGGHGPAYYYYDGAVNVPIVTPGYDADFMVRVWTGAASFDTAAFIGQSDVFNQRTMVWNGPPEFPPDNLLAFSQGMEFGVMIPEPGTIALVALGGAALFFGRRR
jgi:hypothetical protein